MTKRLSRQEVAELGIYDFLGYIGSFSTPFFGGLSGIYRLLEALGIEKGKDLRVLEVGCATGYVSCMIANEFGCHVTGIDISEILIQKASERAEDLGLQNVQFQVADAMILPFEDNSFDIVFGVAINALLPDRDKALAEYMRVVRPGSTIGALDLFLKRDAPQEVADMFNGMMQELLGYDVQIRTIDEWEAFYNGLGLEEVDIRENYESVLVNPQERLVATKATLKLIYHMMINKTVRGKMRRLMRVRKSAVSQNKEQFENIGYLIFTGREPRDTIS
ncbi:MAG: class I SAM-dependent methyltransferase [Candidatus Thorarchaeota archaeon]